MELSEFASLTNLSGLTHPERILRLGWFLHVYRVREAFTQREIRAAYEALHMVPPNLSKEFGRLLEKRPRVLIAEGDAFKLEHSVRQRFNIAYGQHETTIAVSQLMADLPGKIADEAERIFLSEAIKCYKTRAFRAAIIMAWNLAYDHVLRWILADAGRLDKFHKSIEPMIGPKRAAGITISTREDFQEDLPKESEVIKICGHAGFFPSANVKKILDIQLNKRNLAAHPSLIVIGGPEADDTISSLINNVVLVLK